jgi:peptidoglycan/LPS O-acetylase OafA/YrhL
MHRRSMGHGRRLAAIGAVVLIAGCLLPWFSVGGDGGLPPQTYRAVDYLPGVLAFLAGLGTLAMVILPYAMGPRPSALDRSLVFWILAIAALVGVTVWLPVALPAPQGLLPDKAYGFWIALVGAIIMCRAAYDIGRESRSR